MIIVAGHVCLDIIPRFLGPASLDPGSLVRVGAATLSTGGVSNVGVALHRLGVPVKLIHRVGDDLFGQTVRALLGPVEVEVTVSDVTDPRTAALTDRPVPVVRPG